MSKEKIVAFTGYKGSGKDTAAVYLRARLKALGRSSGLLNFATPVKQICCMMYGLSRLECNDPILKEKVLVRWPYQSPRFLLQEFAQEMARDRYPDIWVNYWERVLNSAVWDADYVIVTDLRYPNEMEILKKRNAFVIKVERPELKQIDRHASESYYDMLQEDYRLVNKGDFNYLQEVVEELLTPAIREHFND